MANIRSIHRPWSLQISKLAKQLYASRHFFPLVCVIVLVLLTLLRISGTSVGLYNIAYYGPDKADSNLLAGHPRSIRSDELLFNSPLIVGQVESNSPYLSPLQGQSQNMSVIADAPYKDWSTVFKPQNLAFLFMPLEYAFAFKWWLLGFLLLVSCYYFCLALLPGKRLWASLIALSVFFAPFVQWWYQISTTACLFYSFFIGLAIIHLLKPGQSLRKRLLVSGALAYLLVCFGLILYPPFQIPCVLVMAVFAIGYFLETRHLLTRKQVQSAFTHVLISAVLAVGILVLFAKSRSSVVEAVTNTAYPGKRVVQSGGFSVSHFFSSQLAPVLQSDSRAAKYMLNQSEASNFILLAPFLLLSSSYLAVRDYLRKRRLPWMLIGINLLLILFLCRLFVPHLNFVFHVLQLSSTPLVRMLLGFGLLGTIQLVLLIRHKDSIPLWGAWVVSGLTFVVSLVAGLRIQHAQPGFIDSTWLIIVLSLVMAAIVWCVQRKDKYVTAGLALLAVLAFVSTVNVNPLYRGLAPLTDSELGQAISQTGNKDDVWAVSGTRLIVSQPFTEGRRSLTGVYLYPQPEVWKSLGQNAPVATYNRFAHVIVNLDPASEDTRSALELKAPDHFTIDTSACSDFLRQSNVTYLITIAEIPSPRCANLTRTVTYPTMKFYIYKLVAKPAAATPVQ